MHLQLTARAKDAWENAHGWKPEAAVWKVWQELHNSLGSGTPPSWAAHHQGSSLQGGVPVLLKGVQAAEVPAGAPLLLHWCRKSKQDWNGVSHLQTKIHSKVLQLPYVQDPQLVRLVWTQKNHFGTKLQKLLQNSGQWDISIDASMYRLNIFWHSDWHWEFQNFCLHQGTLPFPSTSPFLFSFQQQNKRIQNKTEIKSHVITLIVFIVYQLHIIWCIDCLKWWPIFGSRDRLKCSDWLH